MGQWLAHERHPSLTNRETWLADKIIPRLSGATHTVINAGWFADNYFLVLEAMAQMGMMPMPLGDGLNAPPSNEDIARVIVGAVTRPELHAGKTYRPTGPELLTPQQIVDHIGGALGRPVKYRPMSERMFLKAMKADGIPIFMQTQLRLYLEDYRRNAFGIGGPTNVVALVGGKDPEDFATIAKRYVAQRPEARQTWRNKLKAMKNLVRMLITSPIDPVKTERSRDHALVENATFAADSTEWLATHNVDNAFGWEPETQREPARPREPIAA